MVKLFKNIERGVKKVNYHTVNWENLFNAMKGPKPEGAYVNYMRLI